MRVSKDRQAYPGQPSMPHPSKLGERDIDSLEVSCRVFDVALGRILLLEKLRLLGLQSEAAGSGEEQCAH